MEYMAGSHFSLMYSDVYENERLWVKVEQSPLTHSSAANKFLQYRGKLQRHLAVCPQNSAAPPDVRARALLSFADVLVLKSLASLYMCM